MYCVVCGREIEEHQAFCRYCGAKNEASIETSSFSMGQSGHSVQVNQVFNRDVLCQYLYNLRFLELYKKRLLDDKSKLEYNIHSLCQPRVSDYWMDFEGLWIWAYWLIGVVIVLAGGALLHRLFDTAWSGVITVILILTAIAVGFTLLAVLPEIYYKISNRKALNADQQRMDNERIQQQQLQSLIPKINIEITHVNKLREEAYSVNIIPSKYRDLYPIYFLYDYVSTSNATLSEALLHCDLDKIQQQLEKIIEQQEDMILELAQANAMNRQLVQQNNRMLDHAVRTENNSTLAAQYTKIAASNTGIIACIQMSEYLHK